MNILIPDSWLRQYLKTKATAQQIADYLSSCSQSVEKVNKIGKDSVYDIEITTNRPDCLSVYGIARELSVILPRHGIAAKLVPLLKKNIKLPKVNQSLPIEVAIEKESLVPRFTAIIFDNVEIGPSPEIVCERLEKSGCRALNNVIDISNYLMYEIGQPMHTFDYDKIAKHKMIVRQSKKGESLVTLDGQNRNLPEGTIVIEDGSGKIIDLCGIMGGQNSAVDENTKRVLLFVQTYDPMKIRSSCQHLSFRTDAASRFEKGVEPEGVIDGIKRAVEMFKENCDARIAGNLIDIYPRPQKTTTIELDFEKVLRLIGITIGKKEILKILTSLGFILKQSTSKFATFNVPHWRHNDVSISEDLIEEVARIYGYQNIPACIPPLTTVDDSTNNSYHWERLAKDCLKFLGFLEFYTYSMTGRPTLEKAGINPGDCIEISNPLNEDLVYMRRSLVPSLTEMLSKNYSDQPELCLFEMANVYEAVSKNNLPKETKMLVGLLSDGDYLTTKGIVETLARELQITMQFKPYKNLNNFNDYLYDSNNTADIFIGNKLVGAVGLLSQNYLQKYNIKNSVAFFDINFEEIQKFAGEERKFSLLPQYPAIVEDLSFTVNQGNYYADIVKEINKVDGQIENIELIDRYQNSLTIRITYRNPEKTMEDSEVKKIREKIIETLKEKFQAKLREK